MTKKSKIYCVSMSLACALFATISIIMGIIAIQKSMTLKMSFNVNPVICCEIQVKGKNDTISVVKTGNAKGNEINAISGATITSKAVTQGVNDSIAEAKKLIEKEGK